MSAGLLDITQGAFNEVCTARLRPDVQAPTPCHFCHSQRSWRYCVGARLKFWRRSRVPRKGSRDRQLRRLFLTEYVPHFRIPSFDKQIPLSST